MFPDLACGGQIPAAQLQGHPASVGRRHDRRGEDGESGQFEIRGCPEDHQEPQVIGEDLAQENVQAAT